MRMMFLLMIPDDYLSYKMLHYPPIVGWLPATSACSPQHVTKGGYYSYVIVVDQITLST